MQLLPARLRIADVSLYVYPNTISTESVRYEVARRIDLGAIPLDAFNTVAEGVRSWAEEEKNFNVQLVGVIFTEGRSPRECDAYTGTHYTFKAPGDVELTIGDAVHVDTVRGRKRGQVSRLNQHNPSGRELREVVAW